MKKAAISIVTILVISILSFIGLDTFIFNTEVEAETIIHSKTSNSNEIKNDANLVTETETKTKSYTFPKFYRGIYLNYWSAKDPVRFNRFLRNAKSSNVNAFVIDVQPSKRGECNIPKAHLQKMIDNGIHPIARIVCFDQGLRKFPVSKTKIEFLYTLAESSAKAGFKEIQFDYIRFNDSSALKRLTLDQKYTFVKKFLNGARTRLSDYDVKIAADVFGRIPLNQKDIIGQNMEVLDEVTDVICPMAYPSHYTWSPKYYNNPYHTVHLTSKRAKERTNNANIVSWIQAFRIKIPRNMSYSTYISEQIKACHDAEISGYLLWNARQEYTVPFKVLKSYYKDRNLDTGKATK